MRTVIQAGVPTLFHYQPLRLEYVSDVLLQHRIKFSDPRTFNDPWDCRPRFSKSVLNDPAGYGTYIISAQFADQYLVGLVDAMSLDRRSGHSLPRGRNGRRQGWWNGV